MAGAPLWLVGGDQEAPGWPWSPLEPAHTGSQTGTGLLAELAS